MQNRNPLASLIALAALSAMLNPALAKQTAATAQAHTPAPGSLDEMIDRMFGLSSLPGSVELNAHLQGTTAGGVPTPGPIAQVCAIPHDIAERCGMNDAGFEPHSLQGRTISLLAAALSNLREMNGLCDTKNKGKCLMADQSIGAAIAALGLVQIPTPV